MNVGDTVDMNVAFGAKLRWAIRSRFGPNQEREFARTIGMDPTQLSRTLNGKVGKRPEIETLQRYADGLGLPLRTVLDWALPEGARAEDPAPAPAALPPAILEAWRHLERKHPELIPQLAARQGDPDFAGQIVDLSTALGYVIQGWVDNLPRPDDGE
jgi:transcriptional regulator with XRE-family HTH domain